MRHRVKVAAVVAAAIPLVLPATAQAAKPVLSPPIATGLVAPLQIAVDRNGTVYAASGFTPVLSVISSKGRTDLAVPAIDGVDVKGGRVQFTTRDGEPGQPGFSSTLRRLRKDGTSTQLADLWAYEQKANPDRRNTYGFTSIPASCAAQLPPQVGPATYRGQLDSNPYAVAIGDDVTYVADSGANAILAVSEKGKVRTAAVLPPQPAVITAAGATDLGLPACTVGLTYRFEPVPTDVEIAPDGTLYVTTLPGGAEGPSLGGRGSVYRVNPESGAVRRVATGFLGATGLAIGPKGSLYVTELFAGRISRVRHGAPAPLIDVKDPAGLEYRKGRLYVSYDVFGNGSIATVAVGG
jgi:hypothetical protein